jgi:hypothetical protein
MLGPAPWSAASHIPAMVALPTRHCWLARHSPGGSHLAECAALLLACRWPAAGLGHSALWQPGRGRGRARAPAADSQAPAQPAWAAAGGGCRSRLGAQPDCHRCGWPPGLCCLGCQAGGGRAQAEAPPAPAQAAGGCWRRETTALGSWAAGRTSAALAASCQWRWTQASWQGRAPAVEQQQRHQRQAWLQAWWWPALPAA